MLLAVLRKIHAWAGLGLCLILTPLALSGASLVFKPQWIRATVPGADVAVVVTPEAGALAMARAEAAFGSVRSVTFAGPEVGLHQVYVADGGGYLSPAGAVVQTWGQNERVVDWLFDLHHHLLSGDAGQTVAGIAGLLAVAMVLTGLVIWAPAWRSFRGRIAPGRGRSGWLSAHRDLGLVATPILLTILLTGAPVALNQFTPSVMGFERAAPPAGAFGAGEVDWRVALAAAQARFPGSELRVAIPAAEAGKPASIRLRQPGEWHANGRTIVYVDPATSRIAAVDDAMTQEPASRLYNAFWPVHASKVGGLPWKIATFLGGLSLAALSIYGAESYRRKLFPVRRRRSTAPARSPA
jgi:uncharacterized iron-regulated membrane protein